MLFDSADVAELADAHGSGPCEVTLMQVQVLSSAFLMPKEPVGRGVIPSGRFFIISGKIPLTRRTLYTKMTGLFKFSPHT